MHADPKQLENDRKQSMFVTVVLAIVNALAEAETWRVASREMRRACGRGQSTPWPPPGERGVGVSQSDALTAKYYEQAAAQGDDKAPICLAKLRTKPPVAAAGPAGRHAAHAAAEAERLEMNERVPSRIWRVACTCAGG